MGYFDSEVLHYSIYNMQLKRTTSLILAATASIASASQNPSRNRVPVVNDVPEVIAPCPEPPAAVVQPCEEVIQPPIIQPCETEEIEPCETEEEEKDEEVTTEKEIKQEQEPTTQEEKGSETSVPESESATKTATSEEGAEKMTKESKPKGTEASSANSKTVFRCLIAAGITAIITML